MSVRFLELERGMRFSINGLGPEADVRVCGAEYEWAEGRYSAWAVNFHMCGVYGRLTPTEWNQAAENMLYLGGRASGVVLRASPTSSVVVDVPKPIKWVSWRDLRWAGWAQIKVDITRVKAWDHVLWRHPTRGVVRVTEDRATVEDIDGLLWPFTPMAPAHKTHHARSLREWRAKAGDYRMVLPHWQQVDPLAVVHKTGGMVLFGGAQ